MKRISPIKPLGLAFIVFATLACMCSIFNPTKPLVITPEDLPEAQAGSQYEASLVISQNRTPVGSVSVNTVSLPPGLELVHVQGESSFTISGTPTEAGIFAFTISAWCYGTNTSGQSAEFPMSITVKPAAEANGLVFSPDELPDTQAGEYYEAFILISNNRLPVSSYSVTEGSLPPGLVLEYVDADYSAVIYGIPTQAGTFTFTLSVWCSGTQESGQTGEKQYTIVVSEAVPADGLVFSPDALPDAHAGVTYETSIHISNNDTPAGGYSIAEGTLPPGLTLEYVDADYSAWIYGTPTQAGTFPFTLSVWCYGTMVSGQTGEKQYTLNVAP
jgi:hypothetical protein